MANVSFNLNVDALKKVKHVVLVMSGKGGVGKTTVAVNLAVALGMQGKKVGLLDIDIHGPNVMRLLGALDKRPYSSDGKTIIPPEVMKIKVMSMASLLEEQNVPIVWRGPLKNKAIEQFIRDVEWGELDYLIVDTPPGTGDEHLTFFQKVSKLDGVIVVTIPSILSQDDVEKAINFVKLMNKKVLGIVENMAYFVCPDTQKIYYIFGKDGAKNLAEKYNLEILGQIPIDPNVSQLNDEGKPIAYYGGEKVVEAFRKLAEKIIDQLEEKN